MNIVTTLKVAIKPVTVAAEVIVCGTYCHSAVKMHAISTVKEDMEL